MELPKNITQIGEVNHSCKIYVEDYVISYLKQLNQVAVDKDMAVALYGTRKEEGEITYLFLYGACKLDFLRRETRHLSQAQLQEIERLKKKYFAEYEFQGYRLLNGEMIEGFHVCEQGICRYIAGYAQFYEKNDSMLAYMLDARGQEAEPEVVNQEKYEMVKRRQEARKAQSEEGKREEHKNFDGNRMAEEGLSSKEREDLAEAWRQDAGKMRYARGNTKTQSGGLGRMKLAAAAVFALLCLAGLSMLKDTGRVEDLQTAAKGIVEGVTEQKLPDATPQVQAANGQVDNSTLVAEDKLTEAIQKENEEKVTGSPAPAPEQGDGQETQQEPKPELEPEQTPKDDTAKVSPEEASPAPADGQEAESAAAEAQPVTYTIRRGDTLIGISLRNYGSDARVSDICALNQITDPDDIKVGQKILLP